MRQTSPKATPSGREKTATLAAMIASVPGGIAPYASSTRAKVLALMNREYISSGDLAASSRDWRRGNRGPMYRRPRELNLARAMPRSAASVRVLTGAAVPLRDDPDMGGATSRRSRRCAGVM